MESFNFGPFTFSPKHALRVAGTPSRGWTMSYGAEDIAERSAPAAATQGDVIEVFGDDRANFIRRAREAHWPGRVSLIDADSGDEIAHFFARGSFGMTPGLIDDRSRYWLRSADKLLSRDVTLTEFAQIAHDEAASAEAWICGLLPDAVLNDDPDDWRAPTSWEIRHVVGEGSFTYLSGAKAAKLIGVTPQNFRKYTARDGASTRQQISFAMWHLLLHKLGVKRA